LSVGEPVKKRETSELSEFEALTPKTINATPPIKMAIETKDMLFISFSFQRRRLASAGNGIMEFPAEGVRDTIWPAGQRFSSRDATISVRRFFSSLTLFCGANNSRHPRRTT